MSFVSVGHPAKSGDLIGYFFRKNNHIPSDQFVRFEDIPWLACRTEQVLVFLDDFSGSGRQAERLWHSIKEQLNGIEIKASFVYATITSLNRARKRLQSTRLELESVYEFGSEQTVFSDDSIILPDKAMREQARQISLKYGARVYPSHPLGYSESACLLGFFYSTPNNTLPIFWASTSSWRPLLPHSEPFRDRPFVIGAPFPPPYNWNSTSATSESHEDDTLVNIASTTLDEFKSLRVVNMLVPLLSQLRLSSEVVKRLLALTREYAHMQNEGLPVATSLLIPHSPAAVHISMPPSSSSVTVNIKSDSELKRLAKGIDGYVSAVVIDSDGNMQGVSFYPSVTDGRTGSVPLRLQRAAEMSKMTKSLIVVCAGDGRADLLFDGYLLLSFRSTKWHYLDPSIGQSIGLLATTLKLSGECLSSIVKMCVQISDDHRGGAFICLGDDRSVLQYSDQGTGRSIDGLRVGDTPEEVLLSLFRQDGATIISHDGRIIRTMTTLRPPSNVTGAQYLPGKGTKHQTAASLSTLTHALCIAVSADGPITFFSRGEPVLKLFS